MYRSDRVGGGCLLYMHASLVVSDVTRYKDKENNMVCCYLESLHTLVAAIYRPPEAESSTFTNLLDKLQQKIDEFSSNNRMPDLYILGDFNFPELSWKTALSPNNPSPSISELLEFMDKNLLSQLVKEPTRGANTLDLILTNTPRYVMEIRVRPTTLSDHSIVNALFGYNMLDNFQSPPPQNNDPFSFRSIDYHEANFDAINATLKDINWHLA